MLRSFKILYKGSQSNSKDSAYELVLFEAYKPHTQAITSIAIDSKSELIATGVRLYLFFKNLNLKFFFKRATIIQFFFSQTQETNAHQ